MADAGNAQLDELAARAQHLARLFFVLISPRRRLFLGGPLAGNRRDDGSFSFLRMWAPRVKVGRITSAESVRSRCALHSRPSSPLSLCKSVPPRVGAETDALYAGLTAATVRGPPGGARSGREQLSGVPIRRTTLWIVRGGFSRAENPANYPGRA